MTEETTRAGATGLTLAASLVLAAGPALAASLEFEVTLPQPEASPAYRPYLAAWIEDAGTKNIRGTVAVWYDTRLRDNLGRGFLRDLRSWWRAEGEKLELPADGLSGPTRSPGTHKVEVAKDNAALTGLSAGDMSSRSRCHARMAAVRRCARPSPGAGLRTAPKRSASARSPA